MASSLTWSFLLLFIFSTTPSIATAGPPAALLSPITFDPSASLYSLSLGNKYSLLFDLAGSNLWLDCIHPTYTKSPTSQPVLCNSAVCNSANVCNSFVCSTAGCTTCTAPASPVCFNNSCSSHIVNSAMSTSSIAWLWTDTFSVLSTDGRNPGPLVPVPGFAFACGDDLLLRNHSIPMGVVGGAGLSRAMLGLPTQLAAKLGLKNKFTYCLPSSGNGKGVILFGDSPIVLQPDIDFSSTFQYTRLVRDTIKEPDSYFIRVNSISVDDVKLPIDSNLLKIKNNGQGSTKGGTIISSTVRYTQLEPSIYNALVTQFRSAAKAKGIKEVPAISSFDVCFDASTALSTRLGYNVPEIDLSLEGSGGDVVWRFFGANSVAPVGDGKVICLAFQSTGLYTSKSIVLGTFQQQDALLQFDLASSRLGFVPTLLGQMATCSNFNFTSSSL